MSFHNYIQERTLNGSELTDFVLSVFRDENAPNKERWSSNLRSENELGSPPITAFTVTSEKKR